MEKPDFNRLTQEVNAQLGELTFSPPVDTVLNPLTYAGEVYLYYMHKFGQSPKRVFISGMNPGPYGMGQVGIPFGDIPTVVEWLGIKGRVFSPLGQHPKKPILGFDSPRREVSGRRFWGLWKELYREAEIFFEDHYVHNYCPLLFLDQQGRNLTPNRLKKADRDKLFPLCDGYLKTLLDWFQPEILIGVGQFAAGRLAACSPKKVITLPHPSPANPRANAHWREDTLAILEANNLLDLPGS